MNEDLLLTAFREVESPVFGVTQQFLEAHKLVIENGRPVVAGIRHRPASGDAVVYFAVAGESFHYTVAVAATPPWQVQGVGTASYCRLTFRAASSALRLPELAALTTLPAHEWSKSEGDRRGKGGTWHYSSLVLQLPDEPGGFEDKIGPLLSYLEQDAAGILQLATEHQGYLEACIVFHNGNTTLGSIELHPEVMRRLVALNLKVVFDLYARGNFFREDD